MKRFLKFVFVMNVFLLAISVFSFVFFAFTSPINYIGNIKTKSYFEKHYIKIESFEPMPGGDAGLEPKFILNGKSYTIFSAGDVIIDSSYYIWFNTLTKRAYLTTKESKEFDAWKLPLNMILLIIHFCSAVVTFFTSWYFRSLFIKKYGLEEFLKSPNNYNWSD